MHSPLAATYPRLGTSLLNAPPRFSLLHPCHLSVCTPLVHGLPLPSSASKAVFPRAAAMSTAEQEYVYSVWAFPTADVSDRLRGVMSGLRGEFGGPQFNPHVTVVGAIRLTPSEAIRRFRAACSGVKPYAARVADVARGTFFYQCVYLLVEPTPEVVGASAHCCSHFEYKSPTPYMPHLSLLYGDLTDEEKEKAKEKVKVLDPSIVDLSFEVAALALYKTDTEDKTLESWEQICVCDLKTGCKEDCC